jgi:hypothetical protein
VEKFVEWCAGMLLKIQLRLQQGARNPSEGIGADSQTNCGKETIADLHKMAKIGFTL